MRWWTNSPGEWDLIVATLSVETFHPPNSGQLEATALGQECRLTGNSRISSVKFRGMATSEQPITSRAHSETHILGSKAIGGPFASTSLASQWSSREK